jgi:hypothetical protein
VSASRERERERQRAELRYERQLVTPHSPVASRGATVFARPVTQERKRSVAEIAESVAEGNAPTASLAAAMAEVATEAAVAATAVEAATAVVAANTQACSGEKANCKLRVLARGRQKMVPERSMDKPQTFAACVEM